MAYQFVNQRKANAYYQQTGIDTVYKVAGINGQQTSAENFHTAITGLLHVVGKDTTASDLGRTISQDVEDDSP